MDLDGQTYTFGVSDYRAAFGIYFIVILISYLEIRRGKGLMISEKVQQDCIRTLLSRKFKVKKQIDKERDRWSYTPKSTARKKNAKNC